MSAVIATCGLLMAPATVSADAMSSYMETALIDVCRAAESNNLIRFNKTVKEYRLKTQTVALKVVCNGENIPDFAATHGAYRTAERLNESIEDVSIEDVALQSQQKIHVNY
ncbi:DUF3718 domain-containing protein [Thalassotalea mangrovi]|uniref:DUF3718 domain-containing protein n=2 Tax=Thalassotalea mangrovi TaxID=2572245 RepID=A0A4U1B3Z4_9GAMM|nr:DUF3718 domain-containing protein [Thalassotalea mangrovi]